MTRTLLPARLAALLLTAVLLSACGAGGTDTADDGPAEDPAAPAAPDEQPADDGEPGAAQEPAPDTPAEPEGPVEVTLTEVARLEQPVATAVLPGDDALYVAERVGRVQVLRDGQPAPEPLLDISEETTTDSERGLLGLAFSPEGDRVYLSYTDTRGDSQIDEWALEGGSAVADSRRPILSVDQPYGNHNGGTIAFGPDGYLYFGLGDGGSAFDPEGNGQDTGTLLGSMLRIDPLSDGAEPYAIPGDNPFVGDAEGLDEIWAYGLRNPWRFSFDAETGDLWIADVGQDEVEEVNFMPAGEGAGANYGWDLFEGSQPLRAGEGEPLVGVAPIYEYPNNGGCSVTGGVVYRGSAVPGLQGAYLFSDFCSGQVQALRHRDGQATGVEDLGIGAEAVVGFGEDAAGEVYVLSFAGPVLRIDPA